MAIIQPLLKPFHPIINWGNPITKGLTFHVPFFENAGTHPSDIVSNIRGTLNGTTPPTWKKSIPGTIMNSTGGGTGSTSTCILYGNPSSSQMTQGTFAGIIRCTQLVANAQKFIFRPVAGNAAPFIDWELAISSGGSIQVEYAIGSTTFTKFGVGNISLNVWHLILFTYDGANIKIYLDGLLNNTIAQTGNFNTSAHGLNLIGNDQNGGSPDALIGDMAAGYIWNRPLTATEILSLYTNPWQIYVRPNYSPFYVPSPAVGGTAVKMQAMRGWSFPI